MKKWLKIKNYERTPTPNFFHPIEEIHQLKFNYNKRFLFDISSKKGIGGGLGIPYGSLIKEKAKCLKNMHCKHSL